MSQSENHTQEGNARRSAGIESLIPFVITIGVILLDQLTKYIVEVNLLVNTYWAPYPALKDLFRITHVTNTGAAFGMFPAASLFFMVMPIIVVAAIVYYNHTLDSGNWLLRIALGLQMGGALGNMIDRLRQGHVTDFLDFGPWFVFNVADMAVVGGSILLGLILLQEQRAENAAKKAAQLENNRAKQETLDEGPTN